MQLPSTRLHKALGVIDESTDSGKVEIESVSDFGEDEEWSAPEAAHHAQANPSISKAVSAHEALAPREASWTSRPRSQISLLERPLSVTSGHPPPPRLEGASGSRNRAQSFTAAQNQRRIGAESIGMLRQTIICDLVKSGPVVYASTSSSTFQEEKTSTIHRSLSGNQSRSGGIGSVTCSSGHSITSTLAVH